MGRHQPPLLYPSLEGAVNESLLKTAGTARTAPVGPPGNLDETWSYPTQVRVGCVGRRESLNPLCMCGTYVAFVERISHILIRITSVALLSVGG